MLLTEINPRKSQPLNGKRILPGLKAEPQNRPDNWGQLKATRNNKCDLES